MMKPIATQSPAGSSRARTRISLALLCASVVALSGCAERKAKAKTFPWSSASAVRPRPLSVLAAASGQTDDASPDLQLDIPPPPSPLAIVQSAPPRPRVPAAPSQNAAARPEPPQIMPQLTAEETTAAQQQTNVSLSIAERNIAVTSGKTLNPTQLDLASKVRSFVTEARESAHVGDWNRARSAAKKAQVLSEELVSSL
jgi:hypothetical protein